MAKKVATNKTETTNAGEKELRHKSVSRNNKTIATIFAVSNIFILVNVIWLILNTPWSLDWTSLIL